MSETVSALRSIRAWFAAAAAKPSNSAAAPFGCGRVAAVNKKPRSIIRRTAKRSARA